MTPTEVALKEKESAILQSFSGIFPSTDTFYATCYLIIRNGHQWEQEKSDMWEEKCETVAWFRHKIERILTQNGLPGEDIVADIASDYFEDYNCSRAFASPCLIFFKSSSFSFAFNSGSSAVLTPHISTLYPAKLHLLYQYN